MKTDIKVIKTEFYFPSADGCTQIHCFKWVPQPFENVKAIIQIAHGMEEHINRYDEFANYLVQNNFIVCGNDHLGHGKSVSDEKKYGYFSKQNGWQNLVDDMHTLSTIVKQEFDDLPYILLGHSMGSFLTRAFLTVYGNELTAAICSGTSGGSKFIDLAIKLCENKIKQNGDLAKANDINKMAFGKYNKKAYPRHSDFDWLSRDPDEVDKYINDPLCGFVFTYGGFLDLFSLLKEISNKKWALKVPDLPIYFFSGNMDPVGNYSHGVVKVIDWLSSTAHTKITVKFYEDGRHEMLNEINKQFVHRDVVKWIDKTLNNLKEQQKQAQSKEEEPKSKKKLF